jgi:2-phospho-L-lactate guanylyltransferase
MIALMPIRPHARGKSRLSPLLAEGERRALVLAMAEDLLRALGATQTVSRIVVCSSGSEVAHLASRHGAEFVDEAALGVNGLNEVANALIDRLLVPDDAVMLLHGDVPLAQPGDIDAVAETLAASDSSVVLVPDRRRDGTNVLALRHSARIPPCYGPGSFARHTRAASEAGLQVVVPQLERLGLDIDSADDIHAFLALQRGDAGALTRLALRTSILDKCS